MALIEKDFSRIPAILADAGVRHPMIVCGKTVQKRLPESCRAALPENAVYFDGFSPNPRYEDIIQGVALFRESGCDGIVSIGGGSAMDVAKCIKLYCKMPVGVLCLEQPYEDTGIFHLAIPTTAGTGSEATHFAVIYYQGVKQSVHHLSILPQAVILEPKLLETLPTYQRKATAMDALCQAIESIWSVYSTQESIGYAEEAIRLLLPKLEAYAAGDNSLIGDMLMGSHLAGKAINITKTTAPHAMSYKLTTLYGISHGHAVSLSMTGVWAYMAEHPQLCRDPRGAEALASALARLNALFGVDTTAQAAEAFLALYNRLELSRPTPTEEEIQVIVNDVNETRLKNHPLTLDRAAMEHIYRSVLS